MLEGVRRTPLHPQWLLGARRPPPGLSELRGRVLDIGAAHRWLERHVDQDCQYIALDYPSTGRDIYGAQPDVFADGCALPILDVSIDGVVCLEVLEHVRNPREMVSEIARVLRPGGRVWISMPFLYPVHDAPHDYQRYTAHGLRRNLEDAGLEVVSIRRAGSAIQAAGLLMSLALVGGINEKRWLQWLLIVPAAIAVLAINCGAGLLGVLWPDWEGMTAVYEVEARRR